MLSWTPPPESLRLFLLPSVSLSLILYLSLPRGVSVPLSVSLSESVCVCFSPVSPSLCVFLSLSFFLCVSPCVSLSLCTMSLCVSRCPCPSLHGVCVPPPQLTPYAGERSRRMEVGSRPTLPRPIVKRRHFQNKSN